MSGGNDLWCIALNVAPKMKTMPNSVVSVGQTLRAPGRKAWKGVRKNGEKTLEDVQRNGENNLESVRKKNALAYLTAVQS